MISEMKGKVVPVKLWTPIHEVESSALDQLKGIAALPWCFHHVAVMPDVHFGKGATVGSVIAMKDALSPAAVGVDIGCVDADTEYLSPGGWRRISEYDGGLVMQYEPTSGDGVFVAPDAYVQRPSNGFLWFRTKYGVNQMLSPDHRVLCWRITGRDRRREQMVMLASDLAAEHDRLVLGAKAEFQTAFCPRTTTSLPVEDAALRVQVAVMADGHFLANTGSGVRVKLVKDRKKARMRELLVQAGIAFSESVARDARYEDGQVMSFVFDAPVRTKTYGDFWAASQQQLALISDECLHWDGTAADHVFFTRDRASADFIQYAFAASGRRAVMRADTDSDGDVDYRVFGHAESMVGIAGAPKTPIEHVPSADGFEYCFTVPSGFWVMRRGGNVVMTGNCGMAAVRTNLTSHSLPDSLSSLRSMIEEEIPVGPSSHAETHGLAIRSTLWAGFKNLDPIVQDKLGNAQKQLGTLGGGNHFIELCLDTDDHVWLMLHSGSRNIGKCLAEVHIARARKLAHNAELPDKDLSVFLAKTPEMASYRHDLMWAQEYAKSNRDVMLWICAGILRHHFPTISFGEHVSCHHNYVSEEHHFGEDVLVTRKGAISARLGERGIIPGSMGTCSYIVKGLGNPESFHSASHGAGRRMSRGEAKRRFNIEDLAEATKGVECRKDSGVLDEIPGAYKDIDAVMDNQADLVEIEAQLKQILCIKG